MTIQKYYLPTLGAFVGFTSVSLAGASLADCDAFAISSQISFALKFFGINALAIGLPAELFSMREAR
jgi:hypothetical protein